MSLLFLNSLGTGEVILILFVVLILFGSKGIPDVVKNFGRGMMEIRNASNEIKRDIQKSALEMRKDLNLDGIEKPLDDIAKDIKNLETPQNTVSTEKKDNLLSEDEDGNVGLDKGESDNEPKDLSA